MQILLIEDHMQIASVIFEFFELKQHQLDHAHSGELGMSLAKQQQYDVIVLDIMLPDVSGLTVCETLRAQGIDTPIMMLTARDEKDDILQGFARGADDYLVKPFDLHILEARLHALCARKTGRAKKELHFNELSLDLRTHVATRCQCQFELNHAQFTLLKLLMLKAPDIATRDELTRELWCDDAPDDDLLRNHVYRLRQLVDKPFQQAYIRTVPKVGYKLVGQ